MSYLKGMTKKTVSTDYIIQLRARHFFDDGPYGLTECTEMPALTGPHKLFIQNEYFFNNHTRCDDYNGTLVKIVMSTKEDYDLLEMIFRNAGLECFMEATGYIEETISNTGRIPDRIYRAVPQQISKAIFRRTTAPRYNVSVTSIER